MRWLVLLMVGAATTPAMAQTTAMDCVPPLRPTTEASADLLRDFENEIRQEFNDYFDDAQSYIRCLEAASQSANAEIQDVLDAHRRMFPNG